MMYRLGRDPNIAHESTLRDMKRTLKLTCEAHIARTYNTFVVVSDNGDCYDVRVEIKLEKK
jgi:hypothetical protein